jgi:hypothetical protein
MSIKTEVFEDTNSAHVHIGGFSINIVKTDEGVVVDIWEKDFEGSESIASTYAFDAELEPEE